jgi:cyanophycinase
MSGTVALVGGGAFVANDEIDRRLASAAAARSVLVLPTADAFEHPDQCIAAAQRWGARLDLAIEAAMVLTRHDALDTDHAARVAGARFVYLAGDSPLHLRSVMKDTPVWAAIRSVLANGGVVAAAGTCAAAICDPMTDPRGGAFTLGLGLARSLAVIYEAETWSPERLHRTHKLDRGFPLITLPTGSALIHSATSGWSSVGEVSIQRGDEVVGLDALADVVVD